MCTGYVQHLQKLITHKLSLRYFFDEAATHKIIDMMKLVIIISSTLICAKLALGASYLQNGLHLGISKFLSVWMSRRAGGIFNQRLNALADRIRCMIKDQKACSWDKAAWFMSWALCSLCFPTVRSYALFDLVHPVPLMLTALSQEKQRMYYIVPMVEPQVTPYLRSCQELVYALHSNSTLHTLISVGAR